MLPPQRRGKAAGKYLQKGTGCTQGLTHGACCKPSFLGDKAFIPHLQDHLDEPNKLRYNETNGWLPAG